MKKRTKKTKSGPKLQVKVVFSPAIKCLNVHSPLPSLQQEQAREKPRPWMMMSSLRYPGMKKPFQGMDW
jgi:hypothetical protein